MTLSQIAPANWSNGELCEESYFVDFVKGIVFFLGERRHWQRTRMPTRRKLFVSSYCSLAESLRKLHSHGFPVTSTSPVFTHMF